MKKLVYLFLAVTILLCSCSMKDLTYLEETETFSHPDKVVQDFVTSHITKYTEQEIEANKELSKRNDKKDYLTIPTFEYSANEHITNINTYDGLLYQNCTTEEFAISKYNTLVRYNGNYDNIVIPDNVQRVERNTFNNIYYAQPKGANSIYIHKNLNYLSIIHDSIPTKSFIVDKYNSAFSDIDGVLCNKNKDILVKYPASRNNSSYTIPDSIKCILPCAFKSSLADEFILNNTLDHLSVFSFYGSRLKKMHIPKNIKVICSLCFFDNSEMKEITFDDGIEKIETRAFQCCRSLKEIKFPKSLKYIGHYAIADCTTLEKVYIPSSVEKIDGDLFILTKSYETHPVVYVEKGSYAESYVKEHGYKYEYYTTENK